MSTVHRHMRVSPEVVWAVLADPRTYASWLVDVSEVQRADRGWPSAGSSFEHRFRWGPLKLPGRTTVLEARPPRHLRLRTRRSPLAFTTLDLMLLPDDAGGTEVRMSETRGLEQVSPTANWLIGGYANARNATSLSRLARLAGAQRSA